MPNLPVIVIFARVNVNLQSPGPAPFWETQALDCRCYLTDERLNEILARDRPDVIVSFGSRESYPRLAAAPYEVQRHRLHYDDEDVPLTQVGGEVFDHYIASLFERKPKAPPLVSVFTPTFRIGERIQRAYQSLLRQTYTNWEWVVVEDSNDFGGTFEMLKGLAAREPRLSVHMMHRHSGVIGELKRRACMIARGDYLVELDHDDELTPNALEDVVRAFAQYPQAGFAYSDWTEIFEESGECVNYGANFGYGYGSYRSVEYEGRTLLVANAMNINPKTIRHIVGVPNHVRAWRRETYLKIGGHNPEIHVADDYEILIRTFLHTRMVRIPRLCYLQYMNASGNTQDERRQEIQRLVRYFAAHYDRQIHQRLIELGIGDFVWLEAEGRCNSEFDSIPNPEREPHCTLVAR